MQSYISIIKEYYLLIIGLIIGIWIAKSIYKFIKIHKMKKYRKQGEKGEDIARKWLPKNGYKIVSEQSSFKSYWLLNNREYKYTIKPDFIVEKDGEKWVIEVKTGGVASPTNSKTRRQIREYKSLLPNYKIALFDATNRLFYEINFLNSTSTKINKEFQLKIFLIGLFIGIIATILFSILV